METFTFYIFVVVGSVCSLCLGYRLIADYVLVSHLKPDHAYTMASRPTWLTMMPAYFLLLMAGMGYWREDPRMVQVCLSFGVLNLALAADIYYLAFRRAHLVAIQATTVPAAPRILI